MSFLGSVPWFKTRKKSDLGSTMEPTSTLLTQPEKKDGFDVKLWGWSLLSFIPWAAVDAKDRPTTINRKLRKRAQSRGLIEDDVRALRFRPYVSKVPWHTGVRGFLSQLFPRYGHYCGPNWSSGKDSGSLIWDKRPIDWLDFCCYCHDIGYDTHDQAKLLKADLAFLDCLERPNMSNKGDARIAYVYRTMCITGLKNLLIPYRTHLVKLQSRLPLIQFGWLSNVRCRSWSAQKWTGCPE
ncbi:hypothetical protein UlMin_015103, partial [Ulmus minor]